VCKLCISRDTVKTHTGYGGARNPDARAALTAGRRPVLGVGDRRNPDACGCSFQSVPGIWQVGRGLVDSVANGSGEAQVALRGLIRVGQLLDFEVTRSGLAYLRGLGGAEDCEGGLSMWTAKKTARAQ
jgi:hypothetical protein